MVEEEVIKAEVKCVANYTGHSVRPNGAIDLNLKCEYGEMPKYLRLVQMLNNDVTIKVKQPDEKPLNLGMFRIKNINIEDDGVAKIKFNSIVDQVNISNVDKLIGIESFVVRFFADIIVEKDDTEEGA